VTADSAGDGAAGDGLQTQLDPGTHVATVEIQRGPNNFFDLGVLIRLADTLDDLAKQGARAVLLCSEGKNFCAGADFSGGSDRGVHQARTPHLYDVAQRLFEQPLPVVAAVQGAAIGGGLGLALAADFRVAAPESRFAANFVKLGFHHGFGISVTLPRAVGQQAALDLLYTGRRIDGTEAHRIGLCDHLVPADQLRPRAAALAAEIAEAAPLAVQSVRETMRADTVRAVREAMARERREQDRLRQTEDFREGVKAVRDRRPARFSGR
jgi:2-(1,2-epoxy-1,2-dihydrophenyl)acetyl-CoA isomerase